MSVSSPLSEQINQVLSRLSNDIEANRLQLPPSHRKTCSPYQSGELSIVRLTSPFFQRQTGSNATGAAKGEQPGYRLCHHSELSVTQAQKH